MSDHDDIKAILELHQREVEWFGERTPKYGQFADRATLIAAVDARDAEIERLRSGIREIERTFPVAPSLDGIWWKRDGEEVENPRVQAHRLLEGQ